MTDDEILEQWKNDPRIAKREHRWSGWPGAWCLDCGCEDKNELWLADGGDPYTEEIPPEYQNGPCPEAGSDRYNPYIQKLLADRI